MLLELVFQVLGQESLLSHIHVSMIGEEHTVLQKLPCLCKVSSLEGTDRTSLWSLMANETLTETGRYSYRASSLA